jgi:uncharacterized protein (DUF1501 family)
MQRRSFLKGCCVGIAAFQSTHLSNLVFASPTAAAPAAGRDVVLSIFLRGGIDGLSLLVPHSDANYHQARPRLGLATNQVLDINGQFGFHPSAAGLKELMDNNDLAVVCAAGSTDPTRSHFEAQDYMERGKPGDGSYNGGGWLARYLSGLGPSGKIFTGLSLGSSVSVALEGYGDALALSDAEDFTLSGTGDHRDDLRRSLRTMYAADPHLGGVVRRTLDAGDIIDRADPGDYVPTAGVTYPDTDFARSLANLAQIIKLDLGLQAATIDTGGWDTHESQADGNRVGGNFANLVTTLSAGLHAFWRDMANYHQRLSVVVMSEFGRRLRENDNRGTDHGHGNIMMVLSGNVLDGKVYGQWPGLANDQLFENNDLQVTTDFRTVLAELMQARLGVSDLSPLFPGFTYPGRLGIFAPPSVRAPHGMVLR